MKFLRQFMIILLLSFLGEVLKMFIPLPIPAVTPIALSGFYSYNGMGFMEMMKLKMHFAFGNRALAYVINEWHREKDDIYKYISAKVRLEYDDMTFAEYSAFYGLDGKMEDDYLLKV